jgi:4-amino-4-deoxy-L-arabinose transferase-like glycosyltransferase
MRRNNVTSLPRPAVRLLLLFVLVFVVLAAAISYTKMPLNDEGWFAAPAYNLHTTGSMGTPALDPSGSWLYRDLPGIRFRTYWIMPLHVLSQVAWFKLFGFSLFSLRTLSIVWGMLAVLSWFTITRILTGSVRVALTAVALLAIDHTFLWSAADGRVDMMSLALGSAGLAVYLVFRERRLEAALWAANVCIAASIFSHPNGVIAALCLAALVARYDRCALRLRHMLSVLPYLVFAGGWGLYIVQNPGQFYEQFRANAEGRPGTGRWAALSQPFESLYLEFLLRYLAHFGFYPMWLEPITKWNALNIVFYWLGPAAVLLKKNLRRTNGNVTLLLLWTITFVFFWNNGLKFQFYMPWVVVFFLPLVAIFLADVWQTGRRAIPIVAIGVFVLLQLYSTIYVVRLDRYHNEYLHATQFIRKHSCPAAVIMGSSTLGFELGYANLVDDARLGFISGIRPDLLVKDRHYPLFWSVFRYEEPGTHRHVSSVLARYRKAFEAGFYTVYLAGDASSTPCKRPAAESSFSIQR